MTDIKRISFDGEYSDLEPFFDATTMQIHQEKHHQTYADKLNATLAEFNITENNLENLLQNINNFPEMARSSIQNNGGGLANHNLFFSILKVDGQKTPNNKLLDEINDTFSSFEKFKEEFTKKATTHFGSGWAWLVRDSSGKLVVYTTPNQDSPIAKKDTPLVGLDLWEHSYYLKFQNRRAEYIESFWNILDWSNIDG